MSLSFDHIHLISEDPKATAAWYENILGGRIVADYELRSAPQINVQVGGMQVIIRGRRPGGTARVDPADAGFRGLLEP